MRTFDEEVRARVLKRFGEVVQGVSAAYGTKADLRWFTGPPPVHNDAELAEAARRTAERLHLQVITPKLSPASEDFAFYQKQIPGFFAFIGTSGPNEWHHPAFDVDERALPISASFFAELAIAELERFASEQVQMKGCRS